MTASSPGLIIMRSRVTTMRSTITLAATLLVSFIIPSIPAHPIRAAERAPHHSVNLGSCRVGQCFDVRRRLCTGQSCGRGLPHCGAHQTCDLRARRCPCESSGTLTPTPTPPLPRSCAFLPCTGNCEIPAPCTPGTVCPDFVTPGTCQVVSDFCTCVSKSGTPGPTPTFGGCALSCDSRPCVGHCADGRVAAGFCTALTVDQGCACAPDCSKPTPTPTPCVHCLPHGHTCCQCPGQVPACADFSWVEVERACPIGCQMFMDAECEAPCGPGPQGGAATCVSLQSCASDQDCNDGNGCTVDQCTINGCTHQCVCVTQ